MPNFVEKLDSCLVKYLARFNYRDYVERMGLKGNEEILEVGCGEGNLSRFLAGKLPLGKLVCIDKSKYWVERAKKNLMNLRNVKFKAKSILTFSGENFDAIIIHYVLHDISERKKSINILKSFLKRDGKIFIREPTRENHGMSSKEIRTLMKENRFFEKQSKEGYSFPLRGKVYEGVFVKSY